MNGKKKCDRLREIRRLICEQNDIPYQEALCTSSGEGCIGTCPKCDLVMKSISLDLDERRRKGLTVTFEAAERFYRSN